jgi:hypothetical protein
MRIRSIKPEFWESESLGRVSREARLLFIGLFSCCDDHGRARASSRLLASRLYPYDDDALKKLPAWIEELEKERCIRLYKVNGESYLDIPKWLNHQKIDKPSASKLPPFDDSREDSRGLEKNSLGTGNREEEQGKEQEAPPSPWDVGFGVELPNSFQTENCLQAVKLWLQYKSERKEGYKKTGLTASLTKWSNEFTPAEFPSCVENSIASGWKGIFRKSNQQPSLPMQVASKNVLSMNLADYIS